MGRPLAVLALALIATGIASASGCTCSRSSVGEPTPTASTFATAAEVHSGRPLPSGIPTHTTSPTIKADAPLDIPSTLDLATLPMECKSWLARTRECITKVPTDVAMSIRSAAITQLDAFGYQASKGGTPRRLIGACNSALEKLVTDHPECNYKDDALTFTRPPAPVVPSASSSAGLVAPTLTEAALRAQGPGS